MAKFLLLLFTSLCTNFVFSLGTRDCDSWGRCRNRNVGWGRVTGIDWTPGRPDSSLQRRNCPNYCSGLGWCDGDGVCQIGGQRLGWSSQKPKQNSYNFVTPFQQTRRNNLRQITPKPRFPHEQWTIIHISTGTARELSNKYSPVVSPVKLPLRLKTPSIPPPPKTMANYWEDLSNCIEPKYECIPRETEKTNEENCNHCENVLHGKCHPLGICFVSRKEMKMTPSSENNYWEDLSNCIDPKYDCVPRETEKSNEENCNRCENVLQGKCHPLGICFVMKEKSSSTATLPKEKEKNYWEDLSNCIEPEYECVPRETEKTNEENCNRCENVLHGKCHSLGICFIVKN